MTTTITRPQTAAPHTDDTSAPGWPSQKVRTIVSLLLFMHLFALGVTFVLSESSSVLRLKLRKFPGFYLRPLAMDYDLDTGLRYDAMSDRDRNKSRRSLMHLTHAGDADVGSFVEFEFQQDGQPRTVRWPEEGLRGERLRHYQMLNWEMGRLASGDENAMAALVSAVAGKIMREQGVQRGTFRVRQLTLASWVDARSQDARQRDPWHASKYRTVYEALVWIVGDQVLLQRAAAVGETAPVANPNLRRPPGARQAPAPGPSGASSGAAPSAATPSNASEKQSP